VHKAAAASAATPLAGEGEGMCSFSVGVTIHIATDMKHFASSSIEPDWTVGSMQIQKNRVLMS
jgi:hypothetical protein